MQINKHPEKTRKPRTLTIIGILLGFSHLSP